VNRGLRTWLRGGDREDPTRLSDALDGVLRKTHDASNALSTALINAEMLRKGFDATRRGERPRDDLPELTAELESGLARLRELVEETKAIVRAARRDPGGESR
jgi:hypothetical protein